MTEGSEFDSWQRKEIFILHSIETVSGAQPSTYQWETGVVSLVVKRPVREADNSLPSSDEDKNGGAIPPLCHTSSRRSD
jgi:hypothetical protein